MEQRVIISTQLESELVSALSECEHDKLFVLTDTTTLELCMPVLQSFYCMKEAHIITIPATDSHKDIDSLMMVWKGLQEGGASRHSCMINLGGGMITDLGGFAASTFKRGINFINIPTTLLAMVDASVGGKTGINFGGLKNEVGVFNDSKFVILDTEFPKTLDAENICSGYAEMLKHGLISTEAMWEELVSFDLDKPRFEAVAAHGRRQRESKGAHCRAGSSRAGHPQGTEPGPYFRSCIRELGIEAQAYPAWLRCGIRSDSRTLSECCQNRIPY